MRYTVENTSKINRPMAVYLDGVEVNNVIEADTTQGYVVRCKQNERGLLYADEHGDVATERLTGRITVTPLAIHE